MSRITPRSSAGSTTESSPDVAAARAIHNEILLGLPSKEFDAVYRGLQLVERITLATIRKDKH